MATWVGGMTDYNPGAYEYARSMAAIEAKRLRLAKDRKIVAVMLILCALLVNVGMLLGLAGRLMQ